MQLKILPEDTVKYAVSVKVNRSTLTTVPEDVQAYRCLWSKVIPYTALFPALKVKVLVKVNVFIFTRAILPGVPGNPA